jgi:hypothetical protein
VILFLLCVAFLAGWFWGYGAGLRNADKQTEYWYQAAMKYLDWALRR